MLAMAQGAATARLAESLPVVLFQVEVGLTGHEGEAGGPVGQRAGGQRAQQPLASGTRGGGQVGRLSVDQETGQQRGGDGRDAVGRPAQFIAPAQVCLGKVFAQQSPEQPVARAAAHQHQAFRHVRLRKMTNRASQGLGHPVVRGA